MTSVSKFGLIKNYGFIPYLYKTDFSLIFGTPPEFCKDHDEINLTPVHFDGKSIFKKSWVNTFFQSS